MHNSECNHTILMYKGFVDHQIIPDCEERREDQVHGANKAEGNTLSFFPSPHFSSRIAFVVPLRSGCLEKATGCKPQPSVQPITSNHRENSSVQILRTFHKAVNYFWE